MEYNHKIITKNAQETAEVGEALARGITPRVICLYGELGSGKTTFTQGLAKGLGVSTRLLSPTFIIVRRYDIPSSDKFLYHIDLYRLTKVDEMEALGLKEIFTDPTATVVVEWAEKLRELLPKDRLDIHFRVLEDGKHGITVKKY